MWQILKDNQIKTSAAEFRKLKQPRPLLDRTLFIEAPQFPVMDGKTARMIAQMHLSSAVVGQCDKIVIRGKVWHWDFKTRDLNAIAREKMGNRTGMVQNPIETATTAGNFFDESRKLWAVPQTFSKRESITFPTR